jgi:hypothetical protein
MNYLLQNPEKLQRNIFKMLIDGGKDTLFGNEHKFSEFETMNNLSGSKEALYYSSLKKFQKMRTHKRLQRILSLYSKT